MVLLDLALQQYAVAELMKRGFTPTVTPDLAQDSVLEGIGFNPRGPETQIYSIEDMNLSLIGTAEITLGGLYSGKTVMDNRSRCRGSRIAWFVPSPSVHQDRDVRFYAS